jgi:aspartyl-tRNA(Asn)/glutamyl-tRNA(Gln) amidotransferase subunit A
MGTVRDRLEAAFARCGDATAAHVFVKLFERTARAEADAADLRRAAGIRLGPLDGTLVSVKDLFDVAGETTTAGSRLLAGAAPALADAPVVRRLRQAGAVILGATNMSEFAFSGIGYNPHYGTPPNAADPRRVPGGSSSGAAISVTAGLCAIGIGSDTGGSTRIPAAFNGIVGWKPSTGRVPTQGAFPLSYTLDSIGPLARTVQDCADADAIMAGEELRPVPVRPLAGLRVGIPMGLLFESTDETVAEAFGRSIDALSAEGAVVTEIGIDDLIRAMRETLAGAPIIAVEAASIHAEWTPTRGGEYDRRVLGRILAGDRFSGAAYVTALRRRAELVAAMRSAMTDIDVLALPTTAQVAPLLGPLSEDDEVFTRQNLMALRNTTIGNFFDLCAISLPMPSPGLPAGLMLMAAHGRDHDLFAVAAGVEAVLGAGQG